MEKRKQGWSWHRDVSEKKKDLFKSKKRMGAIMCPKCGSENFEYLGNSTYICGNCKTLYFKDKDGNFQERKGKRIK